MIDALLRNTDFWAGVQVGMLFVVFITACRIAHAAHRSDR